MPQKIQLRRDTAANWTAANPTLIAGEAGYETNTGKIKYGNGTTAWVALGYFIGGVSDGDKGDITVSAAGTVWTIDADAVTYAKIQNVSATDRLLGRSTAGAGDVEEIVCTAAGRALIDDASAAAQLVTIGGQPLDATLTAFAALTIAANSLTVGTGADAFSQVTFAANTFPARASTGNLEAKAITDFGLSLVDDATAADARTTLGLGTLATQSGTFSGTSSGTNTGDQNLFSTIAVAGQSDVVADALSDTLTLVAGSNVTITTVAGTDTITIAASTGGVSDGDKGDITVSAGGTVWTIDNDVVTYAKMQNVSATDRLLGRSTAGAGDVEEIICTAAGRAILDDATAADQRTTLSAAASGANTDITSVYLNNTGLKLKDTNATHGLTIAPGSDLTVDRTLTVTTGDASRTITLNGDTTLSGTNTGDQTSIVGITGTLAQFNTACTDANFQPEDATLTAFAALTIAAESLTIGTGADAFTQVTFAANTFPARASTGSLVAKAITDFGLSLVDDADAAAGRATLVAAASGANTDLTSVYLNNTGLKLKDTNATHGLIVAPGSDLTADRTLTVTTGDANRTITLNGDTTLTGTNTGDQTTIVGITGTIAQFNTACTDANFQPEDATLTAFAALTIAAESLTIGTGADAFAQTTFAANTFPARASTGSLVAKAITDFGLSLVDDADAAAGRATLVAAASGANTDITSVYLNNTGLKVKDTNATHGLIFAPGSNITADRTLTLTTGDADRTITLNGDTTLSGTNTGDQTSIVGITGTIAQFNTACTDANFQPEDATLTAFAALTIAAESLTIGTGADAFSQTTFAANTFPARASTGSLVAKSITDFGLSLVDDANAATARATLGIAEFDVSFFYPTVVDGTVTLNAKASFAGTINQIRGLKTSSGMCTVAIQINGTDVTGLSALAVTTTAQDATATAANTFVAGDRITVVITANASGLNLEASLKYTR